MARADEALRDLAHDHVNGAAVLVAETPRHRRIVEASETPASGVSAPTRTHGFREERKAPTVPQSIDVKALSQGPWR